MTARAVIFGLSGPALNDDERAFFRDSNPWGFILFARNVETPDQLRALCGALRDLMGRDVPILIDQEGGRVARLRPPHWQAWPPVAHLFQMGLSEEDALSALWLRYRIIAGELRAVGIDVNCAPLLDVPEPGGHEIIGDRALGTTPDDVARRGQAVCDGLRAGGVLPVIKHIPGHGRAGCDSHEALPQVDAARQVLETDFTPFARLRDQPLAMTAHVLYRAIDPAHCATLSAPVIGCIRQEIGFQGALISDDISMKALSGPIAQRAAGAIAAGCDLVLHCNGDMAEMRAISPVVPMLGGDAKARTARALAMRTLDDRADMAGMLAQYRALTCKVAHG